MGAPKNKTYKRSWKNLLLNKGYQLRFTLFMVGLSALLMVGLGWWVMTEARKATMVSINNVRGEACAQPSAAATPAMAPAAVDPAPVAAPDELEPLPADDTAPEGGELDEPGDPAAGDPLAGEATAPADGERARPTVTITSSDISVQERPQVTEPAAGVTDRLVDSVGVKACQERQAQTIAAIYRGERQIMYVLVAVGLLLVVGLFGYGIKMTHKVAGPLHKVTLYFDKLSAGVYDEVYNLRKGDQLRDFYDHFKSAHGGLKQMQVEDIEVLRAVIERAEAEKLAERSPEIAAALDDLRATLKRKEESLV
jgi:hypothetical protein